MPTWNDAIKIALGLPETEVAPWYGTPALKVAGKGFARLRTEAEGGLLVFCDLEAKTEMLESGDPAFYTTPHYDGYGAIIIDLKKVDRLRLAGLIREAWRIKAPPRLRKAYDDSLAAGASVPARSASASLTRARGRSRRS